MREPRKAIGYVPHCTLGSNRCRECKSAYNLAYRLANEDTERARKREYMRTATAADPEKFRARNRERYRANPQVQARVKAAARKWTKAHPLAKQIDRLKYARRQAAAPGRRTTADVAAQFNAQEGKCFYCAHPLTRFHIEHKIPLSRGGTNWPENIVCACASCNLRKGTRTADEFFLVLRGDVAQNEVA